MDQHKHSRDARYYDVFISYAHGQAEQAGAVKDQIEAHGKSVFLDQDFADLQDISTLDTSRIEHLRQILSVSTSLIYCHSQTAARAQDRSVWTPWELGFFDGAVSDRIGVYLLDGVPEDFEAKACFEGVEYLELYTTVVGDELTDAARAHGFATLEDFLDVNAARTRRIDNVRSAFQWMRNLQEETLSNPVNVYLGLWEWNLHHAAKFLGAGPMAEALQQTEATISEFRREQVEAYRIAGAEEWFQSLYGLHPDNRARLADDAHDALKPYFEQLDNNPVFQHFMEILNDGGATQAVKGGGAAQNAPIKKATY